MSNCNNLRCITRFSKPTRNVLTRYLSTCSHHTTQLDADSYRKESENHLAPLKSFEDIPKVKGLPFIGSVLDYVSGENKFKMSKVMRQRYEKFGPIYREKMFPGFPAEVIVYDPKDIETVYRADGLWPVRNDEKSQQVFLDMRAEAGLPAGVANANGENWHSARQPIQKFLMMPKKIAEYHEDFNVITHDLIKNVRQLRDPGSNIITGVPDLLFKWSFETVSFFILGKRLGALSTRGQEAHPDGAEFIKQVGLIFQSIMDLLLSPPLYRVYPTKEWKAGVNSHAAVRKLATKFIEERMAEIREEEKRMLENSEEVPDKVDFLTYLLHAPGKLTPHELTAGVIDLLGAGVDTSSYTLSWALYCLATNPEAQEKLRSEVRKVVGSKEIVTPAHISQMNYLRNSIKETMRMYPLGGFNRRQIQTDLVLSGYKVPKKTSVIMPVTVTGRLPELFHDPDSFIPERWNKENKDKLPSMFASLPFGFGPRMCVGRRLAELEMHIALAHLMNNFKVEYNDNKPMDFIQRFLVIPERQLNLTFKDA